MRSDEREMSEEQLWQQMFILHYSYCVKEESVHLSRQTAAAHEAAFVLSHSPTIKKESLSSFIRSASVICHIEFVLQSLKLDACAHAKVHLKGHNLRVLSHAEQP